VCCVRKLLLNGSIASGVIVLAPRTRHSTGATGADAQPYQEKHVAQAIAAAAQRSKEETP